MFPQRGIGYPEDKTGSNGWKPKNKMSFPKVSLTQWNFAMSGAGMLVNQ